MQQTDRSVYSIPEFLLPESPRDVSHGDNGDSDVEDEYEDDTTQGERVWLIVVSGEGADCLYELADKQQKSRHESSSLGYI